MPVEWDQLHEIAAGGFTIHEPPLRPAGWVQLKPQTVSTKVLRNPGVIQQVGKYPDPSP